MPKDTKGHGSNPRGTLNRLGIPVGGDYHTLHSSKVDELVAEAKKAGYRKPANANGSTGRYFHDHLQRGAGKQTDADAGSQLRAGSGAKSDQVGTHSAMGGDHAAIARGVNEMRERNDAAFSGKSRIRKGTR